MFLDLKMFVTTPN